ncbi:unnamed protein product [Toxocara canis]|uniref:Uncharacterized protein n=1 Tax=Toxocara canis TaxID=6265 RepID=A0A183UG76_TOXCA|nr:unnamed protein product [Toxocara canis]
MHNAVAPSEQQRQPFVPQTNALFCFEFLIEAVDVLNLTTDLRIRQIDFKLDQYEWQSIEQEEWKNVGRRCYLLGEDHFLETLGNKKLRVRAIAHDDSVHSCDISLSSFHVQQGVAYCKGAMELFTSANSTRSVCVLTAMRIFNVDSVHPIPVHRSFLAIDRAVQTSDRHVEHKRVHARPAQRNAAIQTPLTKRRNVMIQVKERNALSNDVSVQCTARWYHEQVEKAVTEVVTRILASKGLVRAIRRRNHGADDHFAKQRNRSLAVVPRIRRPGANILNRRTSRWIPTSGSLSAAAIGFNVICRNQLIHTLDRIIAYKQKLSAQPMNAITTTQRSAQPMNAITTRQRPIVHRICRTANQTLNTDRTLRNSQRMRPKRGDYLLI